MNTRTGLARIREAWLRRSLDSRTAATCGDVLFEAAVFRREDIEAAVSRFETAGADAVLVVLLTYSPSQLALPALQRTRLAHRHLEHAAAAGAWTNRFRLPR